MEVDMRDTVELFKALSDETRLDILALLMRQEELCVCDVEAVLGITQSKSSRHLRYLLNADLVDNRRQGVWMHYRIKPEAGDPRRELLLAVERMIPEHRLKRLNEELKQWLERKQQVPPTCSGC